MKKFNSVAAVLAAALSVSCMSVNASAFTSYDFEDGVCSFVAMAVEDGSDDSDISVVEFNGSNQLKISVKDAANVPKVRFDVNSMLNPDDFDRVKTVEMDITIESKDGSTPPGWAGGALGTYGGEGSPAWGQSDWEGGEYENSVSEPFTIQRKFLLPSERFVNGTENTGMLLMRWSCEVDYNMYIDNIRFLDDDGNAIEVGVVPADDLFEGIIIPDDEETDEIRADEITAGEVTAPAVTETTSATTGNTSAIAAATALVLSGYALFMTKRTKK